jgi:regulator of protease activity HflC (stomatin/prohibitin superfamily)
VQLEEKAEAEATQQRILADSAFYAAQKQAEGEAYQITRLAEADATRIGLTTQAEKEALREILAELEAKGTVAEKYIQVLIAQVLSQNSKWIITDGETMPVIDFRESIEATPPVEQP